MSKKNTNENLPVDTETDESQNNEPDHKPETKKGLKLLFWRPTKKQMLIFGGFVSVIVLLGLVPYTRNLVYGQIFRTNMLVEVYDEVSTENGQKARVQLSDLTIAVDGKQMAVAATSPITINSVRPGSREIQISKSNYKVHNLRVQANLRIGKQSNAVSAKLEATGIPTTVRIENFVTREAVKGVNIKVGESKATSNEKGEALIVLPIQTSKSYKAELSGDGYVTQEKQLDLGTAEKVKALMIVPTGKLYFLSKSTGKIDVVKTNLDGSERQVVIAGTGKEDDATTTLIATTDWKYLALNTKREDKKKQLILIDTSNDTQTNIDEGNANFTLIGWDGKKLAYQTDNLDIPLNKSGRYKLKAYDADTKKLSILFQNTASGEENSPTYNYLNDVNLVNHRLLYTVLSSKYLDTEETKVYSSDIKSSQQKELFKFKINEGYINISYTSANEAYYEHLTYKDNKTSYYAVEEDGSWQKGEKPENTSQLTYFISPDQQQLLWSEERDGKQTVLLGNDKGKDSKKLYSLSELKPFGWYTKNYALYSKKDSELYIASLKENSEPVKLTDYHRPSGIQFRGYGGGYGGAY